MVDVALCRDCRPWIFFINEVLCFLKINDSRTEKEKRWLEMALQGEDESRTSSPPLEAMDKSLKVWEDGWTTDGIPWKAKYPRLYLNSKQQKQYISQMGDGSEGKWEWCLQWRRLLFETEISMGTDFLEEIQAININLQQLDKWVWTNDTTGKYTVKSAYQLLDKNSKEITIRYGRREFFYNWGGWT